MESDGDGDNNQVYVMIIDNFYAIVNFRRMWDGPQW